MFKLLIPSADVLDWAENIPPLSLSAIDCGSVKVIFSPDVCKPESVDCTSPFAHNPLERYLTKTIVTEP